MQKINVNTEKLKECGNDMLNLAIELNQQIDGLFNELTNIENTCWNGYSANEFVRFCKLDKKQYVKFKNNLYKEGKFLLDSAQMLESAATKFGG